MKVKWTLVLVLCLLVAGNCLAGELDGWSISALGGQDMGTTDNYYMGRFGYRKDSIEPFVGFMGNATNKPEMVDLGFLVHSKDVVEPNSVPIISNFLTGILNNDMVITGYGGAHGSLGFDSHRSVYGSVAGIEAKDNPNSQLSILGEVDFDTVRDTAEKTNVEHTIVYLGLKYRVNKKEDKVVTASYGNDTLFLSYYERF